MDACVWISYKYKCWSGSQSQESVKGCNDLDGNPKENLQQEEKIQDKTSCLLWNILNKKDLKLLTIDVTSDFILQLKKLLP